MGFIKCPISVSNHKSNSKRDTDLYTYEKKRECIDIYWCPLRGFNILPLQSDLFTSNFAPDYSFPNRQIKIVCLGLERALG